MRRILPNTFVYLTGILFCLLTACSSSFAPANANLPAGTRATPGSIPAIHQVALLVPLQGPLGASGQAIRNGFLAAYYEAEQEEKNAPTISVIDTSDGDIASLYQQAVTNGANFIVGPLTKTEVQTLANHGKLTVPTLALNALDNPRPVTNLFQFSLSPHDETQQAATKAWNDGHRRAIIIAANAPWAQNIANVFSQQWRSLGGQVVANSTFNSSSEINSTVGQALRINPSEVRNKNLQNTLRTRVNSLADMVFIVALPQQARQIPPFLKFYYAGDLAVYATSAIYSGTPSPNQDQDLNGVQFCDIPWVLNSSAELPNNLALIRNRVMTLWPTPFARNPRLYALGVDAYGVMNQLNQLLAAPQTGMTGATGTLYLTPNQQIQRRLSWAQIRNGAPAAF
ncbi:MAG: penicillin-binding protein activator [Gammaproteobacteria bacterium]